MLRLNMRHSLPQIGMRIQHSRVNQAHDNQATVRMHTRRPSSNQGATQARTDINAYQSRHAYGNSTMIDFARQYGQQGLSDVQRSVSSHANQTWAIINNGAKGGNYVVNHAEQVRQSELMEQRYLVAAAIPDPTTTVEELSRVVGDVDVGELVVEPDVPSAPTINITPGSVETYIQNQGFLRRWITQDHYDIYA